VTVTEKARTVTVSGPTKTLIRKFKHCTFEIVDGTHKKLKNPCKKIRMWCCSKKLKARTRTIASHIKNMIQGVGKVSISLF
jgi:ribosomal protein L6P/L9E